VHMEKGAGTPFNASDDLFSIRFRDTESLFALITKVDDVMLRIKGLRPSDFDLTLPLETYEAFVTSLLLQKDLTKAQVHTAF
ncbi:hypothetical protein K474DRAFT_1583261, partial [Panus rudis PR-1116 ss-1]